MKIQYTFTLFLFLAFSMFVFTSCDVDSGGVDVVDTVISISAIPGVTQPAYGETPITAITETAEYTGTIAWSGSPATFAATTVYTATITLTAKSGYTLAGVPADFFTVAGATSDSNTPDSGVVTAVFPATGEAQFIVSGSGGTAGGNQSYTKGTLVFNMKYVPGGTFPTGTNDSGDQGYPSPQTISYPYWLAETEVTYELWHAVYTWATSGSGETGAGQYSFTFNANKPRAGNDGTPLAVPGPDKSEPVTFLNWRYNMIWCNALTEYYNAKNGTEADLECVYYTDSGYTSPSRSANFSSTIGATAGDQDNPFVKSTAKGFRLPTALEWECAARYKDGTSWTAGGWASGGTGAYTGINATDYPRFNPFAWYGNSTTEPNGNTTSTQPVGLKTANALGIRDMSGNALELCFDWAPGYTGSRRVLRGSDWFLNAFQLQVGYVNSFSPWNSGGSVGCRFARTH